MGFLLIAQSNIKSFSGSRTWWFGEEGSWSTGDLGGRYGCGDGGDDGGGGGDDYGGGGDDVDDGQVVVRALVTQSKGDLAELWIQEVFKGNKIIIITFKGGHICKKIIISILFIFYLLHSILSI